MKRRTWIGTLTGAVGAGLAGAGEPGAAAAVPSYLAGQGGLFASDPHAAALAWFKEARFGLFMHYGLYSKNINARLRRYRRRAFIVNNLQLSIVPC